MLEKIVELEIRTNYENSLLKDMASMVDKQTYLTNPIIYAKVLFDYGINHKRIEELKKCL